MSDLKPDLEDADWLVCLTILAPLASGMPVASGLVLLGWVLKWLCLMDLALTRYEEQDHE